MDDDLIAELSAVEIRRAHADAITEDAIVQGVRASLRVEEDHAEELMTRIKDLGGQSTQRGGTVTVVGRAAGATSSRSSTVEMLRLELAEEQ